MTTKKLLINHFAPRLLTLAALAACFALPAGAGAQGGGLHDDLAAVHQRVDDLIARIADRTSLTKSALQNVRHELTGISTDLAKLETELKSYHGDGPNHPNGHTEYPIDSDPNGQAGWAEYHDAQSSISPSWAEFENWTNDRKFTVGTSPGALSLKIANADYEANWQIVGNFAGNPKVTVNPQANGDLFVTVRDTRTREYLIRNGGLGPVYARSGSRNTTPPVNPGTPGRYDSPMAWAQPYYDLIAAGQLSKSPGMEWFIAQVKNDAYTPEQLADFGHFLRDDLPEQVQGEIGTLHYLNVILDKSIPIPDPRNSTAGFVYAVDKIYNLYQKGTDFSIELK